MPRYFFNIQNDVKTTDLEGVELSGLEAAKTEAQSDVQDIIRTHFATLKSEWSTWSIEICDQEGQLLMVVPFVKN